MSKLKSIRESHHLTQEELSEKSGVSVRTIQRVESGQEPKGFTLKVLAKTLGVSEGELLKDQKLKTTLSNNPEETLESTDIDFAKLKLINLATLPVAVFPPLNILVPWLLMVALKQKNVLTKQLISIQILWTIAAPIVFMLGLFLKLGNQFTIYFMAVIALSNIFIVLQNTIAIDRKRKLRYQLNFSIL